VDKFDLGCAKNYEHKIEVKDKTPVYVKQFKIPDAHEDFLKGQVKEWLKLGIIQRANSLYNSPIFVVPKKDKTLRLVQDFRGLNDHCYDDKFSMKEVSECIHEIGRAGSTVFSTFDLTSGFWQMPLAESSRPLTAFTIPNMDQFQWKVSAMGLKSAPGAFQRMIQDAIKGTTNVIPYIDDCIVHSANLEEHLDHLKQFFLAMRKNNLKLNLKKCFMATPEVHYLGFRLTSKGIYPGSDKLQSIKMAQPPKNVKEIKQFLGLCNFFRHHIKDFSLIASPLNKLTRKDASWVNGEMPKEAKNAFLTLQKALVSEPVVAFPRKDRPYALFVDASTGNEEHDGGLGGILCQEDKQGHCQVIAYASRALVKHEKNYTPFLLEMLAAVWAMDHFDNHLRGRKFTLYTDHKPLEKLGKVHTKTLNRLQQAMNEYQFEIKYKPGKDMPADYLSRNVFTVKDQPEVQEDKVTQDILHFQLQDPFCCSMTKYLMQDVKPMDQEASQQIKTLAGKMTIRDNGILYYKVLQPEDKEVKKLIPVIPQVLTFDIIDMSHSHELAGHAGIHKTKERCLQYGYWPDMEAQIQDFIKQCLKCQKRRLDHQPPPDVSHPLTSCTEFNHRVHMDLFGPLRTSENHNKYIFCMTDAFSRYAVMSAIPDKEATSVANAVFKEWICRFGVPFEILTDRGREFVNKLNEEMCNILKIKHLKTSGYHPKTNTYAEVCNKTIARYLSSFVTKSTLDWEKYLEPMNFSYNTSYHESLKMTPFFLVHGREARLPGVGKTNYSETTVGDWYRKLQLARELALQNHLIATNKYATYNDLKAHPHLYKEGQKVLLKINYFLGKNRKLAEKFEGPYLITKASSNGLLEIEVNQRKIKVNVDRVKPFIETSSSKNPLDEKNVVDNNTKSDDNDAFKDIPWLPHSSHANDDVVDDNIVRDDHHNDDHNNNNGNGVNNELNDPQPVMRKKYQRKVFVKPPLEERRMTRALAKSLERGEMEGGEAQNLLRQVNALGQRFKDKTFKSITLTGLEEAPYRRDEFNLPLQHDKENIKITKRRKFLKQLSPRTRNLILTGDPYLRFDEAVYESISYLPSFRQLPIIQENFDYLLPQDEFEEAEAAADPEPEPEPEPPDEANSDNDYEDINDSESDDLNEAPPEVDEPKPIDEPVDAELADDPPGDVGEAQPADHPPQKAQVIQGDLEVTDNLINLAKIWRENRTLNLTARREILRKLYQAKRSNKLTPEQQQQLDFSWASLMKKTSSPTKKKATSTKSGTSGTSTRLLRSFTKPKGASTRKEREQESSSPPSSFDTDGYSSEELAEFLFEYGRYSPETVAKQNAAEAARVKAEELHRALEQDADKCNKKKKNVRFFRSPPGSKAPPASPPIPTPAPRKTTERATASQPPIPTGCYGTRSSTATGARPKERATTSTTTTTTRPVTRASSRATAGAASVPTTAAELSKMMDEHDRARKAMKELKKKKHIHELHELRLMYHQQQNPSPDSSSTDSTYDDVLESFRHANFYTPSAPDEEQNRQLMLRQQFDLSPTPRTPHQHELQEWEEFELRDLPSGWRERKYYQKDKTSCLKKKTD